MSLPQRWAVTSRTGGHKDAVAPKPTARPGAPATRGHLISHRATPDFSPCPHQAGPSRGRPEAAARAQIKSPALSLKSTAPTTLLTRPGRQTPQSRALGKRPRKGRLRSAASAHARAEEIRKASLPRRAGAWLDNPHRIGLGVGKGPAEASDW